ncbi:MAG: GMC family oxidoreductase [Proteobacteria bacterium]|nr:GMC family oxidoreductase [Pseudomonadota bacterium]MBU1717173.1 GMC family oxidoreductase [Pseudomonadota bacterium]
MSDFDVCVIGSGAGAGPVALTLAEAGHSVVVLEKGPWFREKDFFKDELTHSLRRVYKPKLQDEPQVLEDYSGRDENGNAIWKSQTNSESGRDFWAGNCVGGATNFMSGFFYRMKPEDFRLLAEFGSIAGANIVDWPIGYEELEPYYAKVEKEVGVSGRIVSHPFADHRSTADFPYPPTDEHFICRLFDVVSRAMKLHPLPTPRAILPYKAGDRRGCEYSGYCGDYGCATGAKGSSRAALLDRAVATGKCEIRPHAKVYRLVSDKKGKVKTAEYFDKTGAVQQISAKIFVVACQAVETSRLLLSSTGPHHPKGLGNNHNQVGKNLIFSTGGSGMGEFSYEKMSPRTTDLLKRQGPFVNRGLQDWYIINDQKLGGRVKGGTLDFMMRHPNPISRAKSEMWDWQSGKMVWGEPLKNKLESTFTRSRYLIFEVFADWLPTDNCFVSLDPKVKDKWGTPVARIRTGYHDHALVVGEYLAKKGKEVLTKMGATNVNSTITGDPPANLAAGGCRFGNDPQNSVLNADCRVHNVDNLYVTDGSFMPTGGSAPYTWTIYANAFRVADKIIKNL